MAILEKAMKMKQQGFTESQIIESLREEGYSPKEINDAFSQYQIKTVLNNNPEYPQENYFPGQAEVTTEFTKQRNPKRAAGITGMTPSMMSEERMQPPQLPPLQQDDYEQEQSEYSQEPEQYTSEQYAPYNDRAQQYPQETQYPPQQYPAYEQDYPQYQSSDIETINDIAEQIVEEKTAKLKKEINEITKFKNETALEIKNILMRVEKLENNFHQLQTAILGKIGDYGKDINKIAKEMTATQETFSKMVNPVLDSQRENSKKESGETSPKRKKSTPDFENYLR